MRVRSMWQQQLQTYGVRRRGWGGGGRSGSLRARGGLWWSRWCSGVGRSGVCVGAPPFVSVCAGTTPRSTVRIARAVRVCTTAKAGQAGHCRRTPDVRQQHPQHHQAKPHMLDAFACRPPHAHTPWKKATPTGTNVSRACTANAGTESVHAYVCSRRILVMLALHDDTIERTRLLKRVGCLLLFQAAGR